ncbi:MAG: energy transducer TonB family protein [Myxococcota bacterium]
MRLTATHNSRLRLPPLIRRAGGAVPLMPVWVVGSLLFHAGAFAAARGLPAEPRPPEPEQALLAFTVHSPEPEPEEEDPPPEPEAEPEPEPVAPQPRWVRPEPKAEPEPEEEDPPPEPEEAPATPDEEPPEDADEEDPLEQEATPEAMAGHGIASSEGGLQVGVRAGDGSGLRGGREVRRGRPTPPGPSIDPKALARQWVVRVGKIINERAGREYPLAARRRNLQGVAKVAIFVDAEGRITRVTLEKSSGHGLLDEAAVAAITRLGKVPAPPRALHWRGQRPIEMPVAYRLR